MCEYIDMLEARGIKIGEAQGESKGEDRLAQLIKILMKEKVRGNRNCIRKPKKRHELYKQYGI